MYPTNIENWKAFRFPEVLDVYTGFKNTRTNETKPGLKKFKKESDEWKYYQQKDTFIKLVLNGVSGHLDSEHSWLYNPEGIMKVRCGGQLILLALIEKCIIAGFDVISTNTDGLEIRLLKDNVNKYLQLVKEIEDKFNVSFEREIYSKIIYSSVNSYIAIKENGDVKLKGEFVTNPELGSSVDMMVVPKALVAYFVKGIKPEEFLKSKELTIFDYCISQKTSKDYEVFWQGKKQQRLNRYYACTKGAYLYKKETQMAWQKRTSKANSKKKTPPSFQHMMKETGVMIYNSHKEQPLESYNINYSFYLNQINSKISELERNNQLQLF